VVFDGVAGVEPQSETVWRQADNFKVPREVKGERRLTLAMRWIIQAAKSKKGKPMREKLAEELIAAANNTGEAVKKKENTHRMAEANRAFAHFAW